MQLFYSLNNDEGVISSLMSSVIFWVLLIVIIILIIVLIIRFRKKNNNNNNTSEKQQQNIRFSDQINFSDENENLIHNSSRDDGGEVIIPNDDDHLNSFQGGVPIFNKFIGEDMDLDDFNKQKSNLLGNKNDENKDVHTLYNVSNTKSIYYEIFDDTADKVDFKIELKDLQKIPSSSVFLPDNEIRIYNNQYKCICLMKFSTEKIIISSISSFLEDVYIDLPKTVRLLVFTQESNKLYLDNTNVAAFNIYDKIKYFVIKKSSLIKEIQFM